MTDPIDWQLARRTAARLAPAGPRAARGELQGLVEDLRQAAVAAAVHVGHITTLTEAATQAARGPVHVVDRASLARANVGMFAALTRGAWPQDEGTGGARAMGLQLGAALAAISTRVLGQFDPYGVAGGRLLLVAPNVLRFERELDVDPGDFRLWVALHEQTHAVQFAAAPWLVDHLRQHMAMLVSDLADRRLRDMVATLPEVVAGDDTAEPAVLAGLLDENQRAILAHVVAVMSLLEGHAEVVMDAVGPRVVASIDHIRPKFDARRVSHGRLERTVRRVMGMEAKTAQYREGAHFVRGVLREVGHEGFARVFTAPQALPTPQEIARPAQWVARVCPDMGGGAPLTQAQ